MNVLSIVSSLAIGVFFAQRLYTFTLALRRVQSTGLPYRIIPIHSFNLVADILRPLWLPILTHALPSRWRGDWFALIKENKLWAQGYNLFKRIGHDNFLTLTWSGDVELYTADAQVVSQIMARRLDFPKTLRIYELVSVYGKSVMSTEGPEFRKHMRVVGPPFSEKNNDMVWREALDQANDLMREFERRSVVGDGIINDLAERLGYLTVAVISKAAFGVGIREQYPDAKGEVTAIIREDTVEDVFGEAWVKGETHGHTMSFGHALRVLSENLVWICLVPSWILRLLPLRSAKVAYRAHWNWSRYMGEMLAARRKQSLTTATTKNGPAGLSHDLLDSLVRNVSDPTVSTDHSISRPLNMLQEQKEEGSSDQISERRLSDAEILSNAFIFIVAGHESSAGALHHALLMLACNPAIQRELQDEVDAIFGDRPPDQWDYRSDFAKLSEGFAGAVLSECLRLAHPIMAPPKCCSTTQTITVKGKKCTVPAGTELQISIPAIHRNPNIWPSLAGADPHAPRFSGVDAVDGDTDLGEMKPYRWLTNGDSAVGDQKRVSQRVNRSSVPVRGGGYLPFSAGFRACIGQRFAQVEILAVMALILRYHSVELSVPSLDTREEGRRFEDLKLQERHKSWKHARDRVEFAFANEFKPVLAWRLSKSIPVRFAKRGEEKITRDIAEVHISR